MPHIGRPTPPRRRANALRRVAGTEHVVFALDDDAVTAMHGGGHHSPALQLRPNADNKLEPAVRPDVRSAAVTAGVDLDVDGAARREIGSGHSDRGMLLAAGGRVVVS